MSLVVVALLLGASSCAGDPRTVRTADLDAWRGVPLIELETHPDFSSMPMDRRTLSDGSEIRTHYACATYRTDTRCTGVGYANMATVSCRGGQAVTRCCDNQFLIRNAKIEWFRPLGPCFTECWSRPGAPSTCN